MRQELEEPLSLGGQRSVVHMQRELVRIVSPDLAQRVARRARRRHAEAHPDPCLFSAVARALKCDERLQHAELSLEQEKARELQDQKKLHQEEAEEVRMHMTLCIGRTFPGAGTCLEYWFRRIRYRAAAPTCDLIRCRACSSKAKPPIEVNYF